jgi:glyoxylase-like metal-dependent hydrolase (beta-lactamase superfamily II)
MNIGIYPIRFDNFKVPGEEMITKTDWPKYYPAENQLSNWALRSVLIINSYKKILIDTGFGNKQNNEFFQSFYLNGNFLLSKQLTDLGLTNADITDVVLTHLHFDHCGGCLLKDEDTIVPAFPKATLWISKKQWDSAQHPTEKEADSFLPENIQPLPNYYPVNFITEEGSYLPNIFFRFANGHTAGQIIPVIRVKDKTYLFGADLFPSSAHLNPEVNMGYDIDPELATKEKEKFLIECLSNQDIIIFQHSLYVESCSLKRLNNKIMIDKTLNLR